jgi:hypothetical protein
VNFHTKFRKISSSAPQAVADVLGEKVTASSDGDDEGEKAHKVHKKKVMTVRSAVCAPSVYLVYTQHVPESEMTLCYSFAFLLLDC